MLTASLSIFSVSISNLSAIFSTLWSNGELNVTCFWASIWAAMNGITVLGMDGCTDWKFIACIWLIKLIMFSIVVHCIINLYTSTDGELIFIFRTWSSWVLPNTVASCFILLTNSSILSVVGFHLILAQAISSCSVVLPIGWKHFLKSFNNCSYFVLLLPWSAALGGPTWVWNQSLALPDKHWPKYVRAFSTESWLFTSWLIYLRKFSNWYTNSIGSSVFSPPNLGRSLSWYFGWSPPGISISSIISGGITSGSGSSGSGSSGITSGIGSGLGSGITSGIFGITGPSGALGFNSGSTGF